MKYKIVNSYDGSTIYEDEAASFKVLVEAAVKAGARLDYARLDGARLDGARLDGASLDGASLVGARLVGASLVGARGLHGFYCFGPGGSRNSYTWARWEQDGYMVHCGCQTLTLKDFAAAVKKKHGPTYHGKWYAANIEVMELVAKESEKEYRDSLKEKAK